MCGTEGRSLGSTRRAYLRQPRPKIFGVTRGYSFPSPCSATPQHHEAVPCVKRNFELCYRACVCVSHKESIWSSDWGNNEVLATGGADVVFSTSGAHHCIVSLRLVVFFWLGSRTELSSLIRHRFGRGVTRSGRCFVSVQVFYPHTCC